MYCLFDFLLTQFNSIWEIHWDEMEWNQEASSICSTNADTDFAFLNSDLRLKNPIQSELTRVVLQRVLSVSTDTLLHFLTFWMKSVWIKSCEMRNETSEYKVLSNFVHFYSFFSLNIKILFQARSSSLDTSTFKHNVDLSTEIFS